jgi:glycosyltransferase involved in cell wall biosynthesis
VEERRLSVSFVIPTLNASLYLERCLKSIRNQEYPAELVEILILDGGSVDSTPGLALKYGCRVIENKKRLAEYGVQLGMLNARGELSVIFAADNELVGNDWLKRVAGVFNADKNISALWGRLASGENDPALNKYFALIQSDPLNWFLNSNLKKYLAEPVGKIDGFVLFRAYPDKPLVWGANGLVYRADKIRDIWSQEGYLGDNDAFQYMIEKGNNKVAYFTGPFVYHHHVARIRDWVKKWRRNFREHLLDKYSTRNMRWVFKGNFKAKLFLWALYSALPLAAFAHSLYLSARDRNIYWLLHAPVSCVQFYTYLFLALGSKKAVSLLKR